jgi:hypothetical protein
MAGLGKNVWFTWSNYDGVSTGLGRMNLGRSIDPDVIIPPYASDLMATAQGTVSSVALVAGDNDRIVFSVQGSGFYSEDLTGDLVASGTFDSGWVRMGTLAEKNFDGVEIGHDALAGSVDVALLTFDTPTPIGVGSSQLAGGTFSEILGAEISTRAVRVQLTINRDAGTPTTGPFIRWWTLVGYPAPPRITEIVLPVVLRDSVVGIDGSKIVVDVLAEREYLDGLASSGEMITYTEFDSTESVRVAQIVWPGDKSREQPAPGRRITRRWHQGTALVRLLTKES